jgi:pyruvate/2-oxoglutarate dehydrogenase complex dihydrolipoamide acyltransferase (E2) component
MSFAQIEQAIADYGQKAKDGTLTMADMKGGTFTISNGGVFGSADEHARSSTRRRAPCSASTGSRTARWPATARW